MNSDYPVNFCLGDESYFEDHHPKFDRKKKELFLGIGEVLDLLTRCNDPSDNLGISFPVGNGKKWDALEVHGIDGSFYTLEYQIGGRGGSYVKEHVSQAEVFKAIKMLSFKLPVFEEEGFLFVGW